MTSTIMISAICCLVIGISFKLFFDYRSNISKSSEYRISTVEFISVSIICCILLIPLVCFIGLKISEKYKLEYYEYWNGWETSTEVTEITCEKDGDCKWTYDCDPYIVTYSCNCDTKGNCSICTRTEYHSCPYVESEYNYSINTTLGTYTTDKNVFPKDPNNHKWSIFEYIPDHVIEKAGTEPSDFWKEANNRINVLHKPGPVTAINKYKNYIYASESTILKKYSSQIKKYKDMKLFPHISSGIRNFYFADKLYLVNLSLKDRQIWDERLYKFNSALGSELTGDMHLVLVNSKNISIPDEYVISLNAYWQDSNIFGKNALPKNSLVLVIGTDGEIINWARCFTGMPIGNELLITKIMSALKGKNLDPNIIGDIQRVIENGKHKTIHSDGEIEDLVFGISNKETRFTRISMESKDNWDNGTGYLYLKNEIKPSTGAKIIIIIISIIISTGLWVGAIIFDDRYLNTNSNNWRNHVKRR